MKKILSAILMATLGFMTANAQNKIYAEDATCSAGQAVKIAVKMTNDVEVTSWQLNMVMPEGFTVAQDPDDEEALFVELATERTTAKKHNAFDSSINKDGELIITCASTSNKTYATGDGDICYVTLNVGNDVKPGDHALTIKNPVMTKAGTNESMYPGDCTVQITVTTATAISAITAEGTDNPVYSPSGLRVTEETKGIVIRNGKKVVMK